MALLTSIAAEFREFLATSIPHIISLLEDDRRHVCLVAVGVLLKFSEQGT
jgi:hypothetical protein